MKRATLIVPPPFHGDRILDPKDALNRDDCLAFFHELKASLFRRGYHLRTQDFHPAETSELCLYVNLPRKKMKEGSSLIPRDRSHLLMLESEVTLPSQWSRRRHLPFRTVFTWNDDWADNQKYFKFTHAFRIPKKVHNARFERERLCTLISSGHIAFYRNELYSERIKSIRWFEKNHPEAFEFYGIGWDRPAFTGNRIVNLCNRIPGLRKWAAPELRSWRGPVTNKQDALARYRFAICYENVYGIRGYITEKIFDCMFAGTIPIYWGAEEISDVIPEDCFVDRRRFKSHEDLYEYLTAMSESEHARRIRVIESFLQSKAADQFDAAMVADQLVRTAIERTLV